MPAALYDVNKETLTYMQFKSIMLSLPEFVNEDDVASMFEAADSDCSGRISYAEFRRMCIEGGMVTLRQDGFQKVAKGLTTVDEVLRVTEASV